MLVCSREEVSSRSLYSFFLTYLQVLFCMLFICDAGQLHPQYVSMIRSGGKGGSHFLDHSPSTVGTIKTKLTPTSFEASASCLHERWYPTGGFQVSGRDREGTAVNCCSPSAGRGRPSVPKSSNNSEIFF